MRTNKKYLIIFVLSLFFSVLFIPFNYADAAPERETWTFEATSSASVSSANPDSHLPLSTYVYAKNLYGDEQMALMKFDLSAILALSGQPVVDEAFLDLYIVNPTNPLICKGAPSQFYIGQLSDDWSENTVTKRTMPNSRDDDVNPTANCPAQAGYQTFGVPGLARNWLELRQANFGLVFAGLPYLTGEWTRSIFSSRGSSKPRLRISFYDDTAPSFTATGSSNITKNSAKITWTTDEPSAVKVDWGTTTAYGSSQSKSTEVHELDISSLTPNTTYHFRLTAYDHFQNTKVSGDYTFKTLTESSTAGTTGSTQNNTNSAVSSKPAATASKAKDAVKTVDESIAAPNVKYVTVGDKKTDEPFTDPIKVTTNEEFIIGGDSFPSAKIAIIIGDQAYSTDADISGVWEIKIAANDIEIDNYEVTIQAQDIAKDKGSAINKAFDLSIGKAVSAPESNTKSGPFGLSKMAMINIGGGILILLLAGVLVFLHFKIKKNILVINTSKPVTKS